MISPRTTSCSRPLNTESSSTCSLASASAGSSSFLTLALAASTSSWRFCFSGVAKALRRSASTSALRLVHVLGLVRRLEVPRLLGRLLGQLDDRLDHRLEAAVAEHDGLEHLLLGQLLGLRLHHHHGIAGAGHDEVERALGHLVDHRVEHELAVDRRRRARRRSGRGTARPTASAPRRRRPCRRCRDRSPCRGTAR